MQTNFLGCVWGPWIRTWTFRDAATPEGVGTHSVVRWYQFNSGQFNKTMGIGKGTRHSQQTNIKSQYPRLCDLENALSPKTSSSQ